MNSGRDRKTNNVFDHWFDVDPKTGKRILLPLDFEAMRASMKGFPESSPAQRATKQIKSSASKFQSRGSRIVKPIETFHNNNNTTVSSNLRSQGPRIVKPIEIFSKDPTESEERPVKMRRVESLSTSVRKGLFSTRNSQNTRTLRRRISINRKNEAARKEQSSLKSSPLLNMEEVEEELINKKVGFTGYAFKSPTQFTTHFRKLTNSKSKTKPLEIPQIILEENENGNKSSEIIEKNVDSATYPKTPDSTDEFDKLEAMFAAGSNSNLNTPITKMCNLMQDTVINSVRKTKLNFSGNSDLMNCVNDIEEMIKDEENRHESNMLRLKGLLTALKKLAENENPINENSHTKSNRRSVRLQKKSPLQSSNSKIPTSPAILKSVDLRKSTLKKNLATQNSICQTQSPRTQKAMELYNSIRTPNSVLETPKADRKMIGESPGSLGSRLISMKIHDQCLLLQDTPCHK